MSSTNADWESQLKLAKLVAAFNQDLDEECIKGILRTPGNINYAMPFSEHMESVNHELQPGTVLHQMRMLRKKEKIPKILKLLLRHGVDITVKNYDGQTALHSEVLHQCKNSLDWKDSFDHLIINAILSTHVDQSIRKNPRDNNGISHFHIACMVNHTKAIDFFLGNGVDVNQVINKNSQLFPGCTSLHLAVNHRCLEIAKKLIEHGANIYLKNDQGLTPVCTLIKRNLQISNEETVVNHQDLVLEYQMNQKMTYLLLTSDNVINNNNNNNDSQIMKDENGFSNFHAACTIDDVSLVKNLLMYVEDVNHSVHVKSAFCPGYSALHFAAHFSIDIFKLLLKKHGNIMAKDANGVTPFNICLKECSIQDIEYILSTNSIWKNIVLSDNNTKLLDLLRAMQNERKYELYLNGIEDVNCCVGENFPLWSGYTILHLAVLFSEQAQVRTYATLQSKDNGNRQEENRSKLTMIKKCMSREADFTIQDCNGSTPLHLAFYLQRQSILCIFLKNHKKMIDRVDNNNVSHLHIACAEGMYETMEKLVVNGADVNLSTRSIVKLKKRNYNVSTFFVSAGCTPLHMAVINSNVEIAKFLVQHGADVNVINDEGWSPAHSLMLLSHPERIGKVLLSFSAKLKERVVDDVGLSHLHVACHVKSLRGVKKLIKLGSDVNAAIRISRNNKYFEYFCESNSCEKNYVGFTSLHFAVQQGSIKIASVLLEAGADILAKNDTGMSPLYEILAESNKNKFIDLFVTHLWNNERLQMLLKEDSGITLLHIFAFTMNVTAVEQLLENRVDLNSKVHSDSPLWPGCTALHTWVYGSMNSHYEEENVQNILKLLLDAGADVTLSNSVLDTPLHSFNYSQITIDDEITLSTGRLMLRSQKDFRVNPINAAGVSHFYISIRMCDVAIAEKFLKHGVDVNQRVDYFSNDDHYVERPGCTPLHLITFGQTTYLKNLPDRIETIDLLLKYGGDVSARDIFGNTPLHAVATTEFMREKLIEKIVLAGGRVDATNVAGETPFAVLLKSGRVSSKEIDIFLQQGCHINVYNGIDHTGFLALPLHCATKKEANGIYKVLLKNPDIKIIDDAGRTAIHNIVSLRTKKESYVIHEVYIEMIERLMKQGCDVDARDHTGKTALHTAAQFKNNVAVVALLMNGADINIVDKNKKSPFDYAMDVCRCSYKEYNHRHKDVIKTILIHVKILEHKTLDVSQHNKNLIEKALEKCTVDLSSFGYLKLQLEKTKQIKIADSSLLRLYDFSSETRAVTSYPSMSRLERRAVDKFFTTKNKVLENLSDLRGLFKLQYRKTVKRAALIESANTSLRILSGIPLPELCCISLLKYLSFSDVLCLITSTKN